MWRDLHTWGVDDEQAGNLELELVALAQVLGPRADVGARHIRGADLLRDAARLAVLHVGPSHVVQDLRFACSTAHNCLSCRHHEVIGSSTLLRSRGGAGDLWRGGTGGFAS